MSGEIWLDLLKLGYLLPCLRLAISLPSASLLCIHFAILDVSQPYDGSSWSVIVVTVTFLPSCDWN
jgi:hypothetical protein